MYGDHKKSTFMLLQCIQVSVTRLKAGLGNDLHPGFTSGVFEVNAFSRASPPPKKNY